MRGALPATTLAPLTGLASSALISLLFLPEIVLPKIDFRVSGLRSGPALLQRPRMGRNARGLPMRFAATPVPLRPTA
jgi:hypothetical protein